MVDRGSIPVTTRLGNRLSTCIKDPASETSTKTCRRPNVPSMALEDLHNAAVTRLSALP